MSIYRGLILTMICTSGPKRYDYSPEQSTWVYTRDGVSIGALLEEELTLAFGKPIHLRLEPAGTSCHH